MTPLEKTPYQKFVEYIAKVVNGAYPDHYDASLRREIRLSLGVATGVMLAIAITTTDSILFKGFQYVDSIQDGLISLFLLVLLVQFIRITALRRHSIEMHILNTQYTEIIQEKTQNTVQDTNLLYDYMKVFFILTIVFSTPELIELFISTELIRDIATVLKPLQIYYLLLLVNTGRIIATRWVKYYQNDTQQTENSTKNKS